MNFMLIVLVIIFSFGVSVQALLFPNQELNWALLGNIFLPSYFLIVGDDYILRDTILSTFQVGLTSKE